MTRIIVDDRTGTLIQMGPFDDAKEYYSTFAERYLDMICDGQLFSAYPVNEYLIFKYLKELAVLGRWNPFESSLDKGPFFMKHMDDMGYRILVDDKYNITGIIDWTFARIVPAYKVFSPSLLTADMSHIFSGTTGLSEKDKRLNEVINRKQGKLLGLIFGGPDLARQFSFALGMGMDLLWEEAKKPLSRYHCNSHWYSS